MRLHWSHHILLAHLRQLWLAIIPPTCILYSMWTATDARLQDQLVEVVPEHDDRDCMDIRHIHQVPDPSHG